MLVCCLDCHNLEERYGASSISSRKIDDLSRSAHAKLSLRPGDIVSSSSAYTSVLRSSHYRSKRCSFCFCEAADLMRCGNCKETHYCSKAHQKAAWSTHAKECKYLAYLATTNSRVDDDVTLDEILVMVKTVSSAKERRDTCSIEEDSMIINCGKHHLHAMCMVSRDIQDEIAEYVVREVTRATGCSKDLAARLYSQ